MSISCPRSGDWPSRQGVIPATPTSWVPCSLTVYNESTKPGRSSSKCGRDPNATRGSRAYFQQSLGLFCDTAAGNHEWDVLSHVTAHLLRLQESMLVTPIQAVKFFLDMMLSDTSFCRAEESLTQEGLSPADFEVLAVGLAALRVQLMNSCDGSESKDLINLVPVKVQTRDTAHASWRIILRTVTVRPQGQRMNMSHVQPQLYLLNKMLLTVAANVKRNMARHAIPTQQSPNMTQLSVAMQGVTVSPAAVVAGDIRHHDPLQQGLKRVTVTPAARVAGDIRQHDFLQQGPKRVVGLARGEHLGNIQPLITQGTQHEATIDLVTTLPDEEAVECLDGIQRSINFDTVITLIENAWETRISLRLEVAILMKVSTYDAKGAQLLPGYGHTRKRVVRSEAQWRAFVADSITTAVPDVSMAGSDGVKVGVWCKRGAS